MQHWELSNLLCAYRAVPFIDVIIVLPLIHGSNPRADYHSKYMIHELDLPLFLLLTKCSKVNDTLSPL